MWDKSNDGTKIVQIPPSKKASPPKSIKSYLGKIPKLLHLVKDILAIPLLDNVAKKTSHRTNIRAKQCIEIRSGNVRDKIIGRYVSIQSRTGESIRLEQAGVGLIEGMGLENWGRGGKGRCGVGCCRAVGGEPSGKKTIYSRR